MSEDMGRTGATETGTGHLEGMANQLVEKIRREREERRVQRLAEATGRPIDDVRAEEELKSREAQAAEIARRIVDAAMDRMAAELARSFSERLATELEKAIERATQRGAPRRKDGPGAAQDPGHVPTAEESRIPLSDIQRVVDHLLTDDRETA